MIYRGTDVLYFLADERGAEHVIAPRQPWEGYSLGDRQYQSVPLRWVSEHAWPAWVAGLPEQLRVAKRGARGFRDYPVWKKWVWDCDNHVSDFMAFCSRQLAMMVQRAVERADEVGTPFEDHAGCGVFSAWYVATGTNNRRGGHAINLILTEKGELTPFEPADGITFNPTEKEWQSIWHFAGR